MDELKEYVRALFRHQPKTLETEELRAEILSNMQAHCLDLMARAFRKRKPSHRRRRRCPPSTALSRMRSSRRPGPMRRIARLRRFCTVLCSESCPCRCFSPARALCRGSACF